MAPTDSIAALDDVRKTYGTGPGECTALHELTLRIPRGRMVALIGRSGSGKSTLLNIVGLLDRPTSGNLFITGHDTINLDDAHVTRLRGRTIGFVFQNDAVFPWRSVMHNIAAGPLFRGRLLVPPPAPCEPSPKTPGASCAS